MMMLSPGFPRVPLSDEIVSDGAEGVELDDDVVPEPDVVPEVTAVVPVIGAVPVTRGTVGTA